MDLEKKVELLNKYRSGQEIGFGVNFKECSGKIIADFVVKESMLQPFGLLHGGVTASIGEVLPLSWQTSLQDLKTMPSDRASMLITCALLALGIGLKLI